MSATRGTQPTWAGRVPRNLIERLYRSQSGGGYDDDLIDEVGYALLARCESSLAVTYGTTGRAICPGCLKAMTHSDDTIACTSCDWSTTIDAFRRSHRRRRLMAGRMLPFFEAFVDEFPRARNHREKMILIDVLIHRCHGEYEADGNLRQGAMNLIGGKPAEVLDMLERIGGIRRGDLTEAGHHADWVNKVRSERAGVLDPLRGARQRRRRNT